MMHLKIFAFIISSLISFFFIGHSITIAETLDPIMIEEVSEDEKTNIVVLNDKYNQKQHEKIEDKLINTICKEVIDDNPNVSDYRVKRSFISAHNRLSEKEELTYEEYYTVVALILATMEIESNFKDIVCYNNNGSIDYGTMQVNTAIIPEIEKNLGKLDIKNSIEDNIEAGSWEIYECYKKAKDKHPENVLWYTYAYYNRGLYFENYSYNYEQANTRSIKFIEKFNKYYSVIEGEINETEYENYNKERNNKIYLDNITVCYNNINKLENTKS